MRTEVSGRAEVLSERDARAAQGVGAPGWNVFTLRQSDVSRHCAGLR
jgi:hypothetical protein